MRLAALLVFLALPAAAQEPAALAERALVQLQDADARLAAAESASDRIGALTETVAAYETGLTALRAGLRDVTLQADMLAEALDTRREEVARLLGVLSAISQTPRPALVNDQQGALGVARAGMIVADVTPALQAEAEALRTELAAINTLRALQETSLATLSDGLEGAQAARTALGQALSDRTDLPQKFVEDPVQTALLAASTETLAAFASDLAEATQAGVPQGSLEPQGNLPLPVAGYVLSDDGSGQPGIRIAAAPRALVTTPVAATILFRGPLLDRGNVIILEPTADVLFVLAGLETVYGTAGQVIPAGTPLGFLGGQSPGVDGILNQTDAFSSPDEQETLYLEVREGQSPANPDAWFALE